MATTAFIARYTPDATYEGIVLLYDGCPNRVSKILLENYDHESKLQALLDLGDIFELGASPDECDPVPKGFKAEEYKSLPRKWDHTYVLDNGAWLINRPAE